MRSFRIRWALLALAALSLAALALELDTITDPQIGKLAQQFGPIAKTVSPTDARSSHPRRTRRCSRSAKSSNSVNDFMNRTPFVSDLEHWGKEDYWATPVEFLSTNGGDCEDFSIAKYFALRSLGVPDEKLRITYVKEIVVYNEAHMVLAYFPAPDAEPLVLDNINKTIRPASTRTDLVPVYSFNGSGLWLAKDQTGRGQSVGGSDRIGHWKNVQARLKAAL
jgi:predicted transglutaminase-like cysteine proteinase